MTMHLAGAVWPQAMRYSFFFRGEVVREAPHLCKACSDTSKDAHGAN